MTLRRALRIVTTAVEDRRSGDFTSPAWSYTPLAYPYVKVGIPRNVGAGGCPSVYLHPHPHTAVARSPALAWCRRRRDRGPNICPRSTAGVQYRSGSHAGSGRTLTAWRSVDRRSSSRAHLLLVTSISTSFPNSARTAERSAALSRALHVFCSLFSRTWLPVWVSTASGCCCRDNGSGSL